MATLNALTSPEAVYAALAEFDTIGRDAFLEKYGFGRARSYFVVHEGRLYDSKAVVGAAYGIEHPEQGPLGAGEFSGGDQTVAHRLRALGFDVRNVDVEALTRSYWALLANPAVYDVERAVRTLEVDLWTTGKSAVRAGDRVAIWRAAGRDGRRGVVAFGEVLTDPEDQFDADNPLWLAAGAGDTLKARSLVRYVSAPNLPLWVGAGGAEVLNELAVFRARGGTVFRIEQEQWAALLSAAGGWEGPSPETAAVTVHAAPRRNRAAGGQGFGLNAQERRLVEDRAMELATAHYRKDWPAVTDMSANASYDLLCQNGDARLYVEVKGTTGQGASVLLTRNEVALSEAEYPYTALFVVSDVKIGTDNQGNPVAGDGVTREIRPWRASDMTLRPMTFECSLRVG